MISVVPITLGWRAAQKNPQFGIPEFGVNMSSIIKKTHSVVSQQQHNIAVIKNNFVHLCANEGLCRSFVSKNFPYPYPNQYRQVSISVSVVISCLVSGAWRSQKIKYKPQTKRAFICHIGEVCRLSCYKSAKYFVIFCPLLLWHFMILPLFDPLWKVPTYNTFLVSSHLGLEYYVVVFRCEASLKVGLSTCR